MSPHRLTSTGLEEIAPTGSTNHLDLPALEQVEAALGTFGGTVLLVSHDRRLLEAVTVTRTLRVDDGQVTAIG